jgi:peptidoglycan/xylan/chitin deacetylase (PgdA/CDA1 family)
MRGECSESLQNRTPYFILSLDLELAWGLLNTDKTSLDALMSRKHLSREPIEFLLTAMERHRIPCTWATVGHLFLSRCVKEDGVAHRNMPRFTDQWYSLDPCADLKSEPLFYGRDIIERILSSSVNHEIGYHSFSHVIFSRCSPEVARAEIASCKEFAKEFGIDFKSFVYPRNEVGHVELLKECGFRMYRGPGIWRWKDDQDYIEAKLNSMADRIFTSPTLPIDRDGIWELPTCLHFWKVGGPFDSLWQAKVGIQRAMKEKKVFSVYFHPWELIRSPSLKIGIESLLTYASKMREEGKLSIVTMGELSQVLDQGA